MSDASREAVERMSAQERGHRLLVAAMDVCASGRRTASQALCSEVRDQLQALAAKCAALEAERDCAVDTLKAWFDTKSLSEKEVDPKIIDAAAGYLRTSRVGGMSNEESDLVSGVIEDMAFRGVFSTIFTEYLHIQLAIARREALEEAVKRIMETQMSGFPHPEDEFLKGNDSAVRGCAASIRTLIENPKGG